MEKPLIRPTSVYIYKRPTPSEKPADVQRDSPQPPPQANKAIHREEDAQDDSNTPIPPIRRNRFDPIDDALRSQGYAGRTHAMDKRSQPEEHAESVSPAEPCHLPLPRDVPDQTSPESLCEPLAASPGPASEVQSSSYDSELSDEVSDAELEEGDTVEPEDHPDNSPQPTLRTNEPIYEPVLRNPHYNPLRYPAYDKYARRIGLEYATHGEVPADNRPPSQGSQSYYRPRTHHYPAPDAEDIPYVKELDFRADPSALANAPPPDLAHAKKNFRVNNMNPVYSSSTRSVPTVPNERLREMEGDLVDWYEQLRRERIAQSAKYYS